MHLHGIGIIVLLLLIVFSQPPRAPRDRSKAHRGTRNDLPHTDLADWPYRMVRLACDLCPRREQYRKETPIARFGGHVLAPDVRHLIAQCAHKDAPGAACGVCYADLREGSE
jgi:hypothetical protein